MNRKVILVTYTGGRCGSSMMMGMLHQHPEVDTGIIDPGASGMNVKGHF